MKWYRFNELGTYLFDVQGINSTINFETYVSSDLTNPMLPYKEEQEDFGKDSIFFKFVLPKAPFFLRVFHPDRNGLGDYILVRA